MEEKDLMEKVKLIICAEESVNPDLVFTKTRITSIKLTRQIIAYFCRKYIVGADCRPLAFDRIGEFVKLDHATVMHACKTLDGWIATDKLFREKMNEYDKKIKDYSGMYSLDVSLLLAEKCKRQMELIRKDYDLLEEITRKILPSFAKAELCIDN